MKIQVFFVSFVFVFLESQLLTQITLVQMVLSSPLTGGQFTIYLDSIDRVGCLCLSVLGDKHFFCLSTLLLGCILCTPIAVYCLVSNKTVFFTIYVDVAGLSP